MTDEKKYPHVMRLLHWGMAACILGLIAAGWYMTEMEESDPLRGTIYGLHKSFGALVLILFFVRIAVRLQLRSAIPAMPEGFRRSEVVLAKAAHHLLYVLMFAVPMAGYTMSNSYGYGVSLFGIPLPMLFGVNKERAELAGEAHELLAYTLLAVILLHVAGALKHRLIDKNDVLKRMW